ncbi:MAG TPA: hypothetical protein VFG06_03950 [Thermodesulfovibrionales bacterium]|nr:hypothetical protein [Thermodesulfovibrionales bacterium]
MVKYRLPLILQCLIFLIPLNIYMWGDWIIVDLQWALFRYQQSPFGNSLILGYKDINYIFLGQTMGWYNILSTLFWITGSVLLIIGLLLIIQANIDERLILIKKASIFTIIAGIFFGLSALLRFFGGFAIPVGVPIVMFFGWWMFKEKFEPDGTEEDLDDKEPAMAE